MQCNISSRTLSLEMKQVKNKLALSIEKEVLSTTVKTPAALDVYSFRN
jgi:hypothetical protein